MTGRRIAEARRNETGIALVLSLFLTAALSVVAAALMLLSQTETYSSMNYRLMSQARYGAESGIQKTVNYLLNVYQPPSPTGVTDPFANYDTRRSPVICLAGCPVVGQAVVLSANSAVASNYPVAAVQVAFAAALAGTLPAGQTTVAYAPSATLLSMQQVEVYGGGMQTIQTWQITADGIISVGRTATVQVTATLETQKVPTTMYAAFGTNAGCGALRFQGNSSVDSYSSTAPLVGGAPQLRLADGNVATNGNLTESGSANIYGSLSTPRVGVGDCSDGNVDALTSSGGATVTGGVVNLPQSVLLPAPTVPTGVPTTALNGSGQTLVNGGSYGNVTVNGGTMTLCLPAAVCTINVNSIKFAGNGTILVAAGAKVILNVVGAGQATPIDLTGGSTTNAGFDPSNLQIQYAGTGTVELGGTGDLTAMLYAPNAETTLNGNGEFYGSLVTAKLRVPGNAGVHFDRDLSQSFFRVGNGMLGSFSWNRY